MATNQDEKARLVNQGLGTWIFWGIIITALLSGGWTCAYGTLVNVGFRSALPGYAYLPLLIPIVFPILYFTRGWARDGLMPYRRVSRLVGKIFVKTDWKFSSAYQSMDFTTVIPAERLAENAEGASILVELTFTETGATIYSNIKTGASLILCEAAVMDKSTGRSAATKYFKGAAPSASLIGKRDGKPVQGAPPDKEIRDYLKNIVLVTQK